MAQLVVEIKAIARFVSKAVEIRIDGGKNKYHPKQCNPGAHFL
tara:strand:- start:1949 stop:2077 length:129 start_codon:yes stop_codon:yes gene_type:complete